MQKILHWVVLLLPQLCLVAAFITSQVRKTRELRPITFMLLNDIVFNILIIFYGSFYDDRPVWNSITNLGGVTDVFFIYYYIFSILWFPNLRKQLLICFFLFLAVLVYLWFGPMHTFHMFWVTLYGIENLFIVVPCFMYFYQIFQSDDLVDLRKNPHFFVVCGLIFFYGTTFPFYISFNTLYSVTPGLLKAYSVINALLTTIFYITLIKAYLCLQPGEKSFSS